VKYNPTSVYQCICLCLRYNPVMFIGIYESSSVFFHYITQICCWPLTGAGIFFGGLIFGNVTHQKHVILSGLFLFFPDVVIFLIVLSSFTIVSSVVLPVPVSEPSPLVLRNLFLSHFFRRSLFPLAFLHPFSPFPSHNSSALLCQAKPPHILFSLSPLSFSPSVCSILAFVLVHVFASLLEYYSCALDPDA